MMELSSHPTATPGGVPIEVPPVGKATLRLSDLKRGLIIMIPTWASKRSKVARKVGGAFFGHPGMILDWKTVDGLDESDADVYVVAITSLDGVSIDEKHPVGDKIRHRLVLIEHPQGKPHDDRPALKRTPGSESFQKVSYAKVSVSRGMLWSLSKSVRRCMGATRDTLSN
jgi:hypothetical protein